MHTSARSFHASVMSAARFLTIVLGCLPLLTLGMCPEGTFGTDCRHTCHCASYTWCNAFTGACGASDELTSSCAEGFFGPKCQARNAADRAMLLIGGSELNMNLLHQDPYTRACHSSMGRFQGSFRVRLNDSVPINDVQMTFRSSRTKKWEAMESSFINFIVGGQSCPSRVVRDGVAIAAPVRRFSPSITVEASCHGRVADEITIETRILGDFLNLCAFIVPICSEGFYGAECEHECEQNAGCGGNSEENGSATSGLVSSEPCRECRQETTTLEDFTARCRDASANDPDCRRSRQEGRALDGAKTSSGIHWLSASVGAGITIAVLAVVAGALWVVRRRRSLRSHTIQTSPPLQVNDGYEVPVGIYQSDVQGCYASLNTITGDASVNIYQEVGNAGRN